MISLTWEVRGSLGEQQFAKQSGENSRAGGKQIAMVTQQKLEMIL